MKPDNRKDAPAAFEQYDYDINWTDGAGRPAGIFWLEGRCVMATHGTAAEERLLSRGAFLVGTLRYDADPVERVHRHGAIERVSSAYFGRDGLLPGDN